MATYSNVIAGLRLFASKAGDETHVGGADHDVIYGAPLDVELTARELELLESWGWHKSQECDCWCCFV
jgi:hypothetical protein